MVVPSTNIYWFKVKIYFDILLQEIPFSIFKEMK